MKKMTSVQLLAGEGLNTHVLHAPEEDLKIKPRDNGNLEGALDILLSDTGVIRHNGPVSPELDAKHKSIVLEKGYYRSYPQVEYSPFDNNIRQVFD